MNEMTRRTALGSVAALAALARTPAALADEPPKGGWTLAALYPDDAAWERAQLMLRARVSRLSSYRGALGRNAGAFRLALVAISEARRDAARLYTYAKLKADADLRDGAAQQRRLRAQQLNGQEAVATAWLDGEIASLGSSTIDRFLAEDPGLARFRFGLKDVLRLTPHRLSDEEESVLASGRTLFDGPQTIYNQIIGSDMAHPTITLSTGVTVRLDDQGYTDVRASPVRADRKRVFDSFWTSYVRAQNSIGATLATKVAADNYQARARRYASSLSAALTPQAIPEAVFHQMIAEVGRGLPVLQRYLTFRQRALGLEDYDYCDMYVPVGGSDHRFDLSEARGLMLAAVAPLGPEYGAKLAAASAGGWVDAQARPGKYAGAYTEGGAYEVHPYILLNFTPDYHGVTEYTHEWGHAMHSVLANAAQPYELAGYSPFVGEIASTTNELLLADHMYRTARTDRERLFYLGQQMALLWLNMFREALLSEFELAVHEKNAAGAPLTGEMMSKLYLDLLNRYYGPVTTLAPTYGAEWSFIPQFYTAFYSFQYATSITAAVHFSQAIVSGDLAVRDRYFAMLKAGGSSYPYDLVRQAGVDLATPSPYDAAMSLFSTLLDQGEALISTLQPV